LHAPRASHMAADWDLFCSCQAICLLPGWPYSQGAREELRWAVERRLPIYFLASDARGLTLMADPIAVPVSAPV
jgi:hypothetical protein